MVAEYMRHVKHFCKFLKFINFKSKYKLVPAELCPHLDKNNLQHRLQSRQQNAIHNDTQLEVINLSERSTLK